MMNSFYKPFVTLSFFLCSSVLFFGQTKQKLDECPTTLEITPLESCGDYQFTLGEGQPNEDVYWYFDDGTYEDHVSYTIVHHYANQNSYSGYAQYTSDFCETTTYNFFIIVPECLGTNIDKIDRDDITIFPNPSSDYLYLNNLNENEINSVKIINKLGETVFVSSNIQSENLKINTESISSGIYQMIISNDNNIQSFTISIYH